MNLDQQIMRQVKRMVGYEPTGMLDLLHILTHPDLIDLVQAYITEVKRDG